MDIFREKIGREYQRLKKKFGGKKAMLVVTRKYRVSVPSVYNYARQFPL